MAEKETFYLVWRLDGGTPTFKHTNDREAHAEARRLAAMNPGVEFVILKAITGHVAPMPAVETIIYDPIPF